MQQIVEKRKSISNTIKDTIAQSCMVHPIPTSPLKDFCTCSPYFFVWSHINAAMRMRTCVAPRLFAYSSIGYNYLYGDSHERYLILRLLVYTIL